MKNIVLPTYFDVENWKIIDTCNCAFYDDDETPFDAICVQIGYMTTYIMGGDGVHTTQAPVLRWITAAEYEFYRTQKGVIIF